MSEQQRRFCDPDERRASRTHHRLWRYRLGNGLWLVSAWEAEPLREHRVAPLHVWPGPATAGNWSEQRSHQDLGCVHWWGITAVNSPFLDPLLLQPATLLPISTVLFFWNVFNFIKGFSQTRNQPRWNCLSNLTLSNGPLTSTVAAQKHHVQSFWILPQCLHLGGCPDQVSSAYCRGASSPLQRCVLAPIKVNSPTLNPALFRSIVGREHAPAEFFCCDWHCMNSLNKQRRDRYILLYLFWISCCGLSLTQSDWVGGCWII